MGRRGLKKCILHFRKLDHCINMVAKPFNLRREDPEWTERAESAGLRLRRPEHTYGWGFLNVLPHGRDCIYMKLSPNHSRIGEWPEGLRISDLQIITKRYLKLVYKMHNIKP